MSLYLDGNDLEDTSLGMYAGGWRGHSRLHERL